MCRDVRMNRRNLRDKQSAMIRKWQHTIAYCCPNWTFLSLERWASFFGFLMPSHSMFCPITQMTQLSKGNANSSQALGLKTSHRIKISLFFSYPWCVSSVHLCFKLCVQTEVLFMKFRNKKQDTGNWRFAEFSKNWPHRVKKTNLKF